VRLRSVQKWKQSKRGTGGRKMTEKEMLVELIASKVCEDYSPVCDEWQPHDCGKCYTSDCRISEIADYLIANGVTVQRWISVSEPPKENGYYLCYVLTSAVGDKVKYEQMPLYWEDDIWLYRHNSYRMCRNVTHWMPLPRTTE
jgi:hypothetical protein